MIEINHRNRLIELLRHFHVPLIAVEVGVAGGSFSEELLQSGMEKVYSVDAWEYMPMAGDIAADQSTHDRNYEETVNRLAKYGERSEIIKGLSHKVAPQFKDEFFGLIYHDAGHNLVSVQKDLEMWYPKLVEGGIFSLHDYSNEGYAVKSAVNYFCTNNELEIHLISESGHRNNQSAWFQKPTTIK